MKKTYEELLGGVVEDRGYHRFDLSKHSNKEALDILMEEAEDVVLDEKAVQLKDIKVGLYDDGVPFAQVGSGFNSKEFKFSPWAITQLSEKMNMGAAGYIKKCILNEMYDLIPANLNRWLQHSANKNVLVRYKDDIIRAFLSDRYGIFDHIDAVTVIKECFNDGVMGDSKIGSAMISPDDMSIRTIDYSQAIVPDTHIQDGSGLGAHIRNGQTGRSCISTEFMVYTFFCANGLFIGKDRSMAYSQKHYNIEQDQFKKEFVRSIEGYPDYIAAVKQPLEEARKIPLQHLFDPVSDEWIHFVKTYTKLSKDQLIEVNTIRDNDWDNTLWGLAGAVTQYAQTVGNSARQYQLEKSAGEIIENGLRLAA